MSKNGEPIKPQLDDRYWFSLSEALVSKSQENREQAANKLQNLVIWLWGIYTAFAAVGFALSGKALTFWTATLIAAASTSLIAVYWGTVWVQIPILVEFDPRSPTEIKDAFTKGIEIKNRRLKVTLFLSLVAAIMVSLALVLASVSKERESNVPGFVAAIHSTIGNRTLAVTAIVGQTKKVLICACPLPPGGKAVEDENKRSCLTFIPT